ncbi:MAG: hypothetical protein IRZ32_15800 [Solirubrobacteraceae bacterium]|nr:hypothetical protein [Solirubrobacteraceae bacterium]
MTSARTIAALLSVAAVAAAGPATASAAGPQGATKAATAKKAKRSGALRRAAGTLPGGLPIALGATTVAELQGGSTGDGRLGEEACRRLGELADEAYRNGDSELIGGNVVAAERFYDYGNALVDYGMDNGCFFVW